jgi:uncharacterized heparinase superfamily protein
MQDSIYLGQRERIRRAQQIVLSATSNEDGAVIKWAFQQVNP